MDAVFSVENSTRMNELEQQIKIAGHLYYVYCTKSDML
jgi:hypothetical protein